MSAFYHSAHTENVQKTSTSSEGVAVCWPKSVARCFFLLESLTLVSLAIKVPVLHSSPIVTSPSPGDLLPC